MTSKYDKTGPYFNKYRIDFDSDEELEFWCWLKEAEKYGLVSDIKYQPPAFKLSDRATIKFDKHMKTKISTVNKFILHPHEYTPDFYFVIESIKIKKLNFFIENNGKHNDYMIVDVKGGFNKFGDPKQFSINQKWVFAKFGYYVQKVVPAKLFKASFVPEIARLTPKIKKPVEKYRGVLSISEFVGVRQ